MTTGVLTTDKRDAICRDLLDLLSESSGEDRRARERYGESLLLQARELGGNIRRAQDMARALQDQLEKLEIDMDLIEYLIEEEGHDAHDA